MIIFDYIEDYIEFIGGNRDINNQKLGLFDTVKSPISLARYDVNIVNSLAAQTAEKNIGYTDKQAELALKIVQKYKRQLSQLNPAVYLPKNLGKFRLTIRTVDRSKRAFIRDNCVVLKFPYDTVLIEMVKRQSKDGEGSGVFNYDNKEWIFAITESTINWICSISDKHQIEIDRAITDLYIKILECEQQSFAIELVETASGYDIINAAESLRQYIQTNLGGFGPDNLLQLIDNASVLGYTIPNKILLDFYSKNKHKLTVRQQLCVSKNKRTFKKNKLDFEEFIEYARKTNRLPVYVYATGLPKLSTNEVKYLKHESLTTKIKCLVSESRLLVGTRKQAWLKQAEKIFYIE